VLHETRRRHRADVMRAPSLETPRALSTLKDRALIGASPEDRTWVSFAATLNMANRAVAARTARRDSVFRIHTTNSPVSAAPNAALEIDVRASTGALMSRCLKRTAPARHRDSASERERSSKSVQSMRRGSPVTRARTASWTACVFRRPTRSPIKSTSRRHARRGVMRIISVLLASDVLISGPIMDRSSVSAHLRQPCTAVQMAPTGPAAASVPISPASIQ